MLTMFIVLTKSIRNAISSLSAKILLNERQTSCLNECLKDLVSAEKCKDNVILAEHLKSALKSLRKISGESYNIEEIYDKIFSNFCVGK